MSKREAVNVPSAFIIASILSASTPSYAGLLDFKLLSDAKNAYQNKEYDTSTSLYKKYLTEHESDEANYNLAASLYKNKKYMEAANYYKKIHFENRAKQAGVLYNLANAYAKAGALEQAVQTYSKSLAQKQDNDTKTNKEIVEKLLKEQQKKQQEEQNQRNKEQEDKNNQKKQDQNKPEQQKKDEQKQDSKDTQKEDTRQNQESAKATDETMSNKEEQKWLGRLNLGTPTHMYKLNTMKTQKENTDEKPW